MLDVRARSWWVHVVRDLTIRAMVVIFGAFAIGDGLVALIGAARRDNVGENRLSAACAA
jgi:hypothetical protein